MTITIGASQILLALAHEGPEVIQVGRASERSLEMVTGFFWTRHAIAAALAHRSCGAIASRRFSRRNSPIGEMTRKNTMPRISGVVTLFNKQAKAHPDAIDGPQRERCHQTEAAEHAEQDPRPERPRPLEQPREEQAEQRRPRFRPSRGRNRAALCDRARVSSAVPSSRAPLSRARIHFARSHLSSTAVVAFLSSRKFSTTR